ncbi:MAG TPA: S-methyl-5-thioribose-1-phosphate isomerase, partial [Planctomycetota bacterium]|nr:S-methyl-5-thioribose-1-phosphate isomerase [Planctomycetota bacterium]
MPVETIRWEGGADGHVRMIEQTLLPERVEVLEVRNVEAMFDAIQRLAVRGAPAIGIAAGYGVVLGLQAAPTDDPLDVLARTREVSAYLARSRPTAVNLFWALDRMVARAEREHAAGADGPAIQSALRAEADAIWEQDRAICRRIGELGSALIADGDTLLTHCNAGGLATADFGTALAPIYTAHAQGKRVAVFADETRPLLQGARLTAWELQASGVDVTLITDSMAGRVLFEGRIDAVFVGADRIARNGDTCNKIGTYTVAVLAREHGVPFYVCAPLSTFDATVPDGSHIPIEERAPEEITHGFGRRTAPEGVRVYNPAFDVTPAR